MFERYTEKARRCIFFARYEAAQFGSPYIESEHLLLGILREDKALTNLLLPSHAAVEAMRKQIDAKTIIREKGSTTIDLPFSSECKRILAYGAEEADQLGHKQIGAGHLLLGALRESNCFAARLLGEQGIQHEAARMKISAAGESTGGTGDPVASAMQALRTRSGTAIRLVDAHTSECVLEYRGHPSPPRIGETILLRDPDGATHLYKVADVVWEFEKQEESAAVAAIQVRVAKQSGS